MKKLLLLFTILCIELPGQGDTVYLKPGDKAPSFILDYDNSIHSFGMPYLNRITLLHFWSTDVITSRMQNTFLKRIDKRYHNSFYKNAEGFEIIAIAVQADEIAWKTCLVSDSLNNFTHGIALNGLADNVCKKYGVLALPTDVLVDGAGNVLAVDPRMIDIENILDEQKNNQPLRKDIGGVMAQSSNQSEALKYGGLYLLNYYGDTVSKTITNEKGAFRFSEVKLNQELAIKVDNKVDINTTDPIALYSSEGVFLIDGRTKDEGFVFAMPARLSNRLIVADTGAAVPGSLGEIDVVKNLAFSDHGTTLTPRDEQEVASILKLLQKNDVLQVEITTHTDARADKETAMSLTSAQAMTLKTYFTKKGISPQRIQAVAKGNAELRKLCDGPIECSEQDHLLNRRVEFLVFKN